MVRDDSSRSHFFDPGPFWQPDVPALSDDADMKNRGLFAWVLGSIGTVLAVGGIVAWVLVK